MVQSDAYANPSDQKVPYASPVCGNFSNGFPPTLNQITDKAQTESLKKMPRMIFSNCFVVDMN